MIISKKHIILFLIFVNSVLHAELKVISLTGSKEPNIRFITVGSDMAGCNDYSKPTFDTGWQIETSLNGIMKTDTYKTHYANGWAMHQYHDGSRMYRATRGVYSGCSTVDGYIGYYDIINYSYQFEMEKNFEDCESEDPPAGFSLFKQNATVEECTEDTINNFCSCPTSYDPTLFDLYKKPGLCDDVPNSKEVNGACECNQGYTENNGQCSTCYELVDTPLYVEQIWITEYSNCNMTYLADTSGVGGYVSTAKWVACLDECVVGITFCSQGQEVKNHTCVNQEEPKPDTNCSGWQKTDFLNLRDGGVNYGYPAHVVPPNCYNVYECVQDFTQKLYRESACGHEPDDTNSSTDPHDTDNQTDDPQNELDNNQTAFDTNSTINPNDINSTSGATKAMVAELKRIEKQLFDIDDSLKGGFSDVKSKLVTLDETNKKGFSDVVTEAKKMVTAQETTNDKLSDMSINLNTIEDELESIDSRLIDTRDDDDYKNFITKDVHDAFSSFQGRGVLPFSGVVSAVPSVGFTLHGKTYSLLSADMLASVDWSIFRGFLLFLAAISGFHRIFTNV